MRVGSRHAADIQDPAHALQSGARQAGRELVRGERRLPQAIHRAWVEHRAGVLHGRHRTSNLPTISLSGNRCAIAARRSPAITSEKRGAKLNTTTRTCRLLIIFTMRSVRPSGSSKKSNSVGVGFL